MTAGMFGPGVQMSFLSKKSVRSEFGGPPPVTQSLLLTSTALCKPGSGILGRPVVSDLKVKKLRFSDGNQLTKA